jgi:hypothetical protein
VREIAGGGADVIEDGPRPHGGVRLAPGTGTRGDEGALECAKAAGVSACSPVVLGMPPWTTIPSLSESRADGSLCRSRSKGSGGTTCGAGRGIGVAVLIARPSTGIVPLHFLQRKLTTLPRTRCRGMWNFELQLGHETFSGCAMCSCLWRWEWAPSHIALRRPLFQANVPTSFSTYAKSFPLDRRPVTVPMSR